MNNSTAEEVIYGSDYNVQKTSGGFLIAIGFLIFSFVVPYCILRRGMKSRENLSHSYRIALFLFHYMIFYTFWWIVIVNCNDNLPTVAKFLIPFGIAGLCSCPVYFDLVAKYGFYIIGICPSLSIFMFITACANGLEFTQNVDDTGRRAMTSCLSIAFALIIGFIFWWSEKRPFYFMLAVIFTSTTFGAYLFIVGVDFVAHTGLIASIEIMLDHHYTDYSLYSKTAGATWLLVGGGLLWGASTGVNYYIYYYRRDIFQGYDESGNNTNDRDNYA